MPPDPSDPPPPPLDATRLASGPLQPSAPPPPALPSAAETLLSGGARSGAAPQEEAPSQLGGYRLIKRIGGGGMGSIYLAVQTSVGRQVAIKVLPRAAFDNPEAVERFEREVQVLGQLSHPNICPVLEAGVEGQTRYCVMEHLRGLDLARVLREQRVDARRAAAMALQVARALQYAHERGVIHRDVKPQNVMLLRGDRPREEREGGRAASSRFSMVVKRLFGRGGGERVRPSGGAATVAEGAGDAGMPTPEWRDKAVLIDFGLARDGGGGSALTQTGAVVGTPAYMAPEQARGDRRAISAATDVYSLGATLYEALALRAPFDGETVGAVLQAVIHEDPPPVRRHAPDVDRDLETVVQKAMEKEPARRYATAGEMADDLERWLAGEPIRARRAGLAYRVRRRILRNPLAAAAIAAAAALAGIGAWHTFGPGEIELLGDLEGATVTVNDAVRQGRLIRVWPPGTVELLVQRRGSRDFYAEFEVKARSRVPVNFALVSTTGTLAVESEPPGAEVFVDGEFIGRAPVSRRVPVGTRAVTLRLHDHVAWETPASVEPDAETRVVRPLVHESGFLSVESDPRELGLELFHESTGEKVVTAAPAERFPLKTGRWRGTARARNCFPREVAFEVKRGAETTIGVMLPEMAIWKHVADGFPQSWLAEDVNGDRYPDIVLAGGKPMRMRALDGRTGRLLWLVEGLPQYTSVRPMMIDLADLDGDLRPEVFYAGDGELRVYDAATGRKLRATPAPEWHFASATDDVDGDGLADVAFTGPKCIGVARGRDGARIWTCATADGQFGFSARLNGDAVGDFVVSDATGIFAVDGRNGKRLWEAAGPNGFPTIADLNGDGVDDVWLWADAQRVHAFSGTDGRPIWANAAAAPSWNHMGVAADLDGDGTVEIVQTAGETVRIFSEKPWTGVAELPYPSPSVSPSVLDLTGDGRPEVLLPSHGRLLGVETRTGRVVWEFETDSRVGSTPLLADFDGDGRQDLAVQSTSGSISLLAASAPPVRWRQGSPHYYTEHVEPDAEPPSRLFVPGMPSRWIGAADGRVLSEMLIPGVFRAAPTMREGRRHFFVDGTGVGLLDPELGRALWWKPGTHTWTRLDVTDVNGDGVDDVVSGDVQSRGLEALDGRDGARLWTSGLLRVLRASGAVAGGRLWVPVIDGRIHGLDLRTGEDEISFAVGSPPCSIVAVDGDLVFATRAGRVARVRPPEGGAEPEVVWSMEAGFGLAAHSPVVQAGHVGVAGARGSVMLIRLDDGRALWRRSIDSGIGCAPALCDLDGDGVPEAAIPGGDGLIAVLRGSDGTVAWSWELRTEIGWQVPVWSDLDGNRRPELLVITRDVRVFAFNVDLERRPVVWWPRPPCRASAATVAASRDEALRQRARDAWREGRWDLALAAGREGSSAELAWIAAMAASRLGDREQVLRHARAARERGCRRLDVAFARAALLPEAEALEAATTALFESSFRDLLEFRPEGAQETLRAAAAARACERAAVSGDWAREILVLAAAGDPGGVAAAADRALAAGADRGRVLLQRGRAALLLERFDEAAVALGRAAGELSARVEAAAELQLLDELGDVTAIAAAGAWRLGEHERAVRLAERAAGLRPDLPERWNQLAWFLAMKPGVTLEEGRRAVGAAERAVALLRDLSPEDAASLSGYLDTLAAAHFAAGDIPAAVAAQREALALPAPDRAQMEARLKKYEEAGGKR